MADRSGAKEVREVDLVAVARVEAPVAAWAAGKVVERVEARVAVAQRVETAAGPVPSAYSCTDSLS